MYGAGACLACSCRRHAQCRCKTMESLQTLGWAARYPVCWLVCLDASWLGMVLFVLRVAYLVTYPRAPGPVLIGSVRAGPGALRPVLSTFVCARARANRGAVLRPGRSSRFGVPCGAGERKRWIGTKENEKRECYKLKSRKKEKGPSEMRRGQM